MNVTDPTEFKAIALRDLAVCQVERRAAVRAYDGDYFLAKWDDRAWRGFRAWLWRDFPEARFKAKRLTRQEFREWMTLAIEHPFKLRAARVVARAKWHKVLLDT